MKKCFPIYFHFFPFPTSSTGLLRRREETEAAAKQKELREAARREGRPEEDIVVQPGEVDWLYGYKKVRLACLCFLCALLTRLRRKFVNHDGDEGEAR